MSRIVLATIGSLGDLHPYLAVGIGLKARGHQVVIASLASYRCLVEAEGLEFSPVGPNLSPDGNDPELLDRALDLKKGTAFLLRSLVLPYVEQTYQDLLSACRGADLFCIHPILFPAPVVAEKLNLRWVSILLAPGGFGSAYDPPVIPPLPWLHALRHLGHRPNRFVFGLLDKLTRGWMKPIDDLRRREGLPPATKHPINAGMYSPYGTLAMFSRIFGAPQPDWPVRTKITGFAFYHRPNTGPPIDESLERFLAAGPPPVVFTLGSSAVQSSGGFYQKSFEAVRRLGCRAVFLIGTDPRNLPAGPVPDTVLLCPYASYSDLFPRAAAVVHSGGIGSTAQAMFAGVPMLIVPFAHDQPDNGYRAARLGCARVLTRARYSAESAAGHLRLLLDRPEYAQSARRVAAQLALEDGVGSACDALDDILKGALQ